jgi:ketosteroid isomerase-like protein
MQDQSDVIRALYDAFARGDMAAVLGAFAPDIVWNEAEGFVYADRNPYVGPQAVLEGVFMRLGTEWDGFNAMPEEIIGSGDSVIARGRYRRDVQDHRRCGECPIRARLETARREGSGLPAVHRYRTVPRRGRQSGWGLARLSRL